MDFLPDLYFLDDQGNKIPLLHFVILHNIYGLIKGKFELNAIKLQESVWIEKVQEKVNCLQLSVLRWGDVPNHIYQFYQTLNLPDVTLAPLKNYNNVDLFQYSMLRRRIFLEKIIEWEGCPVNKAFPSDHPDYPNWLPIHFALERAFFGEQQYALLIQHPHIDLTKPFPESDKSNLGGFYPLSAIFYSGNPCKNNQMSCRSFVSLCKDMVERIVNSEASSKKKETILTHALYAAVVYHNVNRQHDHSKSISLLLDKGADPFCNLNMGYRIIDIAYDKGLIYLFNRFMDSSVKVLKREPVTLIKNERPSELNQITGQSYRISEDRYAVVSLVRNMTSKIPDHVFLIVERIVRGQAEMHFIDFVQNKNSQSKKAIGKIRHKSFADNINKPLIHQCKLPLMKIEAIQDVVAKPWLITIEACEQLLTSIEGDKDKEIPYVIYGNRSILGSISGKGESCYSWARKHLLTIKDPHIEQQMQPDFHEWFTNVPRWKLQTNETSWLSFSSVNTFFRKYPTETVGLVWSWRPWRLLAHILTEILKLYLFYFKKGNVMKERKSEINPTFVINEERWAISLARLANVNQPFTQHAFLILEGIEAGKATIYFIDFVGAGWFKSLPNTELGKVRFERYETSYKSNAEGNVEDLVPLIYRGTKRMMILKSGDRLHQNNGTLIKMMPTI